MFYLDLKGYVRFKETAGEDDTTLITIAILDQEHRSTILTWLYGSVLTAAMQMKNRFALHASALRVNNRLYLF